jgi:fucose 4-O-acetylase-like acetyltransferase
MYYLLVILTCNFNMCACIKTNEIFHRQQQQHHTSTTFLLRMLFMLLLVFHCRTMTGSSLCTRGCLFMFCGGNTSLKLGCPSLILSCLKALIIRVVDKLYPYTWYIQLCSSFLLLLYYCWRILCVSSSSSSRSPGTTYKRSMHL